MWLWVVLGCLLLLLILLAPFFRRATASTPPTRTPAPATTDLLAEQEEAAFDASVTHKRAEILQRQAEEALPKPPAPEEEILWNESDDVYRPASVDADAFARSLALTPTPIFKREQSVVFVDQNANDAIRTHLKSNLKVELGGLLVGEAFYATALDAYLVRIHAALPADGGVETATSFEYTAASWEKLTPLLNQMNPDWTVVGSYHSHPGLGVFLSTTDLDTQVNIFSHAWQVAIVFDPVSDEIGFFLGDKGTPCSEWHLIP